MVRILSILLATVLAQQVNAQSVSALAGAQAVDGVKRITPEAAQARVVDEADSAAGPARVRIGLRLTPFKKVVTRGKDGAAATQYVAGEVLRHTLRARLNKANHFFVGDWHIESVPLKWIKKARRYEVRLNFFRRYGPYGQLEENVGSVDLGGVLEEQQDNVHVLLGVGRKRLRDKFGSPYVDVVAGFSPATTEPRQDLSKNLAPQQPAAQPNRL